jgi:gluconokinase
MNVIGLDIGTTSTKAVIFTFKGEVVAEHGVEYPILTPQPSWAEQDPDVILTAAVEAIKRVVEKAGDSNVIGLGISSAMHSLILMDEQDRPLTKTIIWADNRSIDQVERLKMGTGTDIYMRTGTPIHPMSPLSKMMWFKEQHPDLFGKTNKFISIKDYLLFHWFGEYVTDYSIASATGLLNLSTLNYDDEVLDLIGISRNQLPQLVATTHVLKGLHPQYAARMGIDANLPFVIGGSDGCLANLGIGAVGKNEAAITIGTSGAIRTVVSRPLTDEKERTFCYALTENMWVVGGPTNNGGILLQWFQDQFAKEQSYESLLSEASEIAIGSEGLVCLPYLSGERAPIWNANARGCFFGMSLHHRKGHFIRAALEGVIFSVYGVGRALQDLSGEFTSLRASGGFVQSPLWCQIAADVFGADLIVPQSHQSSSWGAAILALYANGVIPEVTAYKDSLLIGRRYTYNPEAYKRYQQIYQLFEEIYVSLVPSFDKAAQLQRNS